MGTLYRYELKKLLCQKVLWIAVALMTLILVGVGITDVVTGRAAISKNYKEFSGREIDDSLIKEVQEAEDQDHYIVFRSFINFCNTFHFYTSVFILLYQKICLKNELYEKKPNLFRFSVVQHFFHIMKI